MDLLRLKQLSGVLIENTDEDNIAYMKKAVVRLAFKHFLDGKFKETLDEIKNIKPYVMIDNKPVLIDSVDIIYIGGADDRSDYTTSFLKYFDEAKYIHERNTLLIQINLSCDLYCILKYIFAYNDESDSVEFSLYEISETKSKKHYFSGPGRYESDKGIRNNIHKGTKLAIDIAILQFKKFLLENDYNTSVEHFYELS